MKRFLAFVIVLILAAAGATAAWVFLGARQAYRGYGGAEQFVDIRPGTGTRAIGQRLVAAGVVRDQLTLPRRAVDERQATRLKAGEYRFTEPATPGDVIDKLARGDVFVIPLTIPEGLSIRETAKIVEAKGFGPASGSSLTPRAIRRPFTLIDPAARDLEGYLFLETYPLSRHADAPGIVRLMADAFNRALSPELRAAAAAPEALDPRTRHAGVDRREGNGASRRSGRWSPRYENRLRIGMPLQCDPTVIYALEQAGRYHGNLHHDDLSFDSPYNTYRYPGLPPGPIAAPGRASLDAVVHPADSNYLYFVSRNDGSHEFAATLEEHNRNVAEVSGGVLSGGQGGQARRRRAGKAGRSH